MSTIADTDFMNGFDVASQNGVSKPESNEEEANQRIQINADNNGSLGRRSTATGNANTRPKGLTGREKAERAKDKRKPPGAGFALAFVRPVSIHETLHENNGQP